MKVAFFLAGHRDAMTQPKLPSLSVFNLSPKPVIAEGGKAQPVSNAPGELSAAHKKEQAERMIALVREASRQALFVSMRRNPPGANSALGREPDRMDVHSPLNALEKASEMMEVKVDALCAAIASPEALCWGVKDGDLVRLPLMLAVAQKFAERSLYEAQETTVRKWLARAVSVPGFDPGAPMRVAARRVAHPLDSIEEKWADQEWDSPMRAMAEAGMCDVCLAWIEAVPQLKRQGFWADIALPAVTAIKRDPLDGPSQNWRKLFALQESVRFEIEPHPARAGAALSLEQEKTKKISMESLATAARGKVLDAEKALQDALDFRENAAYGLLPRATMASGLGLSAPELGRADLFGSFLAENGDFLIEQWGMTRNGNTAQKKTFGPLVIALEKLNELRTQKAATADQAWAWAKTVKIRMMARKEDNHDEIVHESLIENLACSNFHFYLRPAQLYETQEREDELWSWLESARGFDPSAPLPGAVVPLVQQALRGDARQIERAARWIAAMRPAKVNPDWAAVALAFPRSDDPAQVAARLAFVSAVNRAVERQKLTEAVRAPGEYAPRSGAVFTVPPAIVRALPPRV